MNTWTDYPKISAVEPLPGHRLLVTFTNGEQRWYDFASRLDSGPFTALRSETLFKCARVDVGGYGVVWNDDLDIAESELWLNGQPVGENFRTALTAH